MSTWEQTYPFPGGDLIIDQMEGAVVIRAWDRPEVQVKAVWPGEGTIQDRLRVFHGSRHLSLQVLAYRTGFLGLNRDGLLDLEISAPVGTRCRVESRSGPVVVEGTRAHVTASTGSGQIALTEIAGASVEAGSGNVVLKVVDGNVDVETGSGEVHLDQVRGRVFAEVGSGNVSVNRVYGALRVETGSGDLFVHAIDGQVEIETGSGNATIKDVRGPWLRAETGGGSIRAGGMAVGGMEVESGSGVIDLELLWLRPGGSYRVETGSGGATIALPAGENAFLDLQTGSGRITWEGLELKPTYRDEHEVQACLGTGRGGARISVEAESGGVRLKPATGVPLADTPTEQLKQVVQLDSALANHEAMKKVLAMVEEGKLTPEEAEELLRALDEETSA